MTRYVVQAERDERGWILTVPEVTGAVSHVRRLADGPEWIREAIGFVTGQPAEEVEVEIMPLIGGLEHEVQRARAAVADAERAQVRAAQLSRATARRLKDVGLTGADTAAVLGVSPQRVSQLVRATATAPSKP